MPVSTSIQQTQAVITPGPELDARATSGPLWAYWPTGNGIQTFFCGTDEFFAASATYAGCYGKDYLGSGSSVRVGCTQLLTSISGLDYRTAQCVLPSESCVVQTIYATSPNLGSSYTDYFCGAGAAWSAVTVFRDIPSTTASSFPSSSSSSSSVIATTFTSTSSTTISASPAPPSSTSSPTSSATSAPTSPSPSSSTSSPTSSAISTPTSTATVSSSSSSKAWIAGPVIGGIAVVAFVAFIVWYFMKRKRNAGLAAGAGSTHPYNSDYPPYSEAKPTEFAEIQGTPVQQYYHQPHYRQHQAPLQELHELS